MLSFLFPPICPLCAKELLDKGEHICKSCSKKQIFIKEPTCYSCGKPMKNHEKEYCSDCMADYDVDVHYIKEFDDIEKFILKNCKKNDLLITMGAGNVDSIGNSLVNR